MNGKPVLDRANARTVLTLDSEEFQQKKLCDGITLNPGDTCAFSCRFCYVPGQVSKFANDTLRAFNDDPCRRGNPRLGFEDVVIRRPGAEAILREQLFFKSGNPRFDDPNDTRIVYGSTLVDVAANMELLRETAGLCKLILENTHWQIRLLSKSSLLHRLFKDNLIPSKHRDRMILGFSTGTLDDGVAAAIEVGTAKVSQRLKALHWLQNEGYRTFGMVCPSLPQDDYEEFSARISEAIRVDHCEHVWAEVINLRGESFTKTLAALHQVGLEKKAEALSSVMGQGNSAKWEAYARATFEAHAGNIPVRKLRFLQYVNEDTRDWWLEREKQGAVALGKAAHGDKAPARKPSCALIEVRTDLGEEDQTYLDDRESVVRSGLVAAVAAARALWEIHSYKEGVLWKRTHTTFEAYCRDRFDIAKSQAYRRLRFGEFVHNLQAESPNGDSLPLPSSEGQVRQLVAKLPPDHWLPCWREVTSRQDPVGLTGREVDQQVRDYTAANELTPRIVKAEKQDPIRRFLEAISRLSRSIEDHPRAEEISRHLEKVINLLQHPDPIGETGSRLDEGQTELDEVAASSMDCG